MVFILSFIKKKKRKKGCFADSVVRQIHICIYVCGTVTHINPGVVVGYVLAKSWSGTTVYLACK